MSCMHSKKLCILHTVTLCEHTCRSATSQPLRSAALNRQWLICGMIVYFALPSVMDEDLHAFEKTVWNMGERAVGGGVYLKINFPEVKHQRACRTTCHHTFTSCQIKCPKHCSSKSAITILITRELQSDIFLVVWIVKLLGKPAEYVDAACVEDFNAPYFESLYVFSFWGTQSDSHPKFDYGLWH